MQHALSFASSLLDPIDHTLTALTALTEHRATGYGAGKLRGDLSPDHQKGETRRTTHFGTFQKNGGDPSKAVQALLDSSDVSAETLRQVRQVIDEAVRGQKEKES